MITVSFLECGITNNLDGSQYELVYYSTENTDELDDSFIENLQVFASDFTLREFEGFSCLKTLNILLQSNEMQW